MATAVAAPRWKMPKYNWEKIERRREAAGLALLKKDLAGFHRMVMNPKLKGRGLAWVHEKMRAACVPIEPPQRVMDEWERSLPDARETSLAMVAKDLGVSIEDVIEDCRPKPSIQYRPLFVGRSDQRPREIADMVLLVSILHDTIGVYRSTPRQTKPMKPVLGSDAVDFTLGVRWATAMDGLPGNGARVGKWESPRWFDAHTRVIDRNWFRAIAEAFEKEVPA